MDKPIVFLSHSSKDAKSLVRLKEAIERKTAGTIQFFLSSDGESIPYGKNWLAVLEDALKQAKLAFIFVSPHSVGSSWVYFESGWMSGRNINVVPVGILETDLNEVPSPLKSLQGFNINSHDGLNNLIRVIDRTFNCKFGMPFNASDYQEIFQAGTATNLNYFGKFASFIEGIGGWTGSSKTASATLREILQKKGIQSSFHSVAPEGYGHGPDTDITTTYGLEFTETPENNDYHFGLRISANLSSIAFEVLDELFTFTDTKKINLTLTFDSSVSAPTETFQTSAKAFGSRVGIGKAGALNFEEITFKMRQREERVEIAALINGKLLESKLNELIATLFELEILQERRDLIS